MIVWNLNETRLNSTKAQTSQNQLTGDCIKTFNTIHTKSIRNAIWFNKEAEFVSVSYDQTCAVTDLLTGRVLNRLECKNVLTAVCEHPNELNIALIGSKNEVYAWDTRTNKISKTYKSRMGQVS